MRPDDLYNMTMFEYRCKLNGYARKEARYWDKVRTIGFFIFKSVGDKKSQSPKDIMAIPLIDGADDSNTIRPTLMKKLMEAKLKEQQERDGQQSSITSTTDKD